MPTYDYRCKACGHTFELFQTMSEREKRKCPECEKNTLERLIGAGAGLIFKGSGYYLTDYRSKSYEEGAKAERDAAQPPPSAKDSGAKGSDSQGSEGKTSDAGSGAGKEAAETKGAAGQPSAKAAPSSPTKPSAPSRAPKRGKRDR